MIPVDAPRRAATGYGGGRAPASANEPPTSIPRTPAAAPGRTSPAPRVPTSRPRRYPGRRPRRPAARRRRRGCQRAAHVEAQDAEWIGRESRRHSPRANEPPTSRPRTRRDRYGLAEAEQAPSGRHTSMPRTRRDRYGTDHHVGGRGGRHTSMPRTRRDRYGGGRAPASVRVLLGSPEDDARGPRLDPQPRAAPGDSSRRRHAPAWEEAMNR